MEITVYGRRFEGGFWTKWEHPCDENEIEWVIDSANAKTFDNGRPGRLTIFDVLEGARYIFNVAFGSRKDPQQGDVEVLDVRVNEMAANGLVPQLNGAPPQRGIAAK